MITVLVLKSCTLMPEFRVLEEGQTVQLPPEIASWIISGGLGRAVPAAPASVADAPDRTEISDPPAPRGRKGRG